jgi:Trk-type K+ transport system membrane component
MTKWFEIFGAILCGLFFPLVFAVVAWQTERAGRRKGLSAFKRWIRFTVVSAITCLVAIALLILPMRLRLGIPTTNGFLISAAYGAFLSSRLTYHLALVAAAAGLIGIISSGIAAKARK